jgi:peptidoglycan/xylan/chitin deacetylase (PgdA/CDA1 family)
MRRRRSRLPLVVLAVGALLLGASIALLTSGVRPSDAVLAWLNGQAAGTASPDASAAASGDVAAATDGTAATNAPPSPEASGEPGASPSSGPTPTTGASTPPAGSPVASGPAATPRPSASTASSPGVVTAGSGQARAVSNGSRAKKVVALTFDDGYSPVALRQILAILKRERVTATFFPYGWAVHQDPEGWHMVAAAGYPIGNHTLRHTILTTVTPDQVYEEMTRGRKTIDLYSGARSIDLMRPPGGAFNAPVAKAIKRAGYDTIVLWDVDTFDWQGPSAETIYQRAIKGTNGSIVLMHSGPLNTPKALPRIIANYRARGFSFVTVPALLGTG